MNKVVKGYLIAFGCFIGLIIIGVVVILNVDGTGVRQNCPECVVPTNSIPNENQPLFIGDLGSQSTKITQDERSLVEISINEEGNLIGTTYHPDSYGNNLIFSGIEGKVIRIVKTYTCANDSFELLALIEDGSVYHSSVTLAGGNVNINFTKVETTEPIYGIDTQDEVGEGITCQSSFAVAYTKNNQMYQVQKKLINCNDSYCSPELDENGNEIYEVISN